MSIVADAIQKVAGLSLSGDKASNNSKDNAEAAAADAKDEIETNPDRDQSNDSKPASSTSQTRDGGEKPSSSDAAAASGATATTDGATADGVAADDSAYADAQLTLRALVSTKEAGIIIGKAGKNVAELRESTGVKAGVSKVVPGVHDRVLTITGALQAVTEAYTRIAQTFLDNPLHPVPHQDGGSTSNEGPGGAGSSSQSTQATLRLLVSHNLMGTIIGRSGLKIKMIQDTSHCRMVASKEMLPQSTERVVEVTGEITNLRRAVWEIGKCLVEDWERGVGTVLYNPAVRLSPTSTVVAPTLANGVIPAQGTPGNYLRSHRAPRTGNAALDFTQSAASYGFPGSALPHARLDLSAGLMAAAATGGVIGPDPATLGGEYRTQTISIPADFVGCVIGKGGAKITEIRRSSGSKIAIAKEHDAEGERLFTVSGTAANNEKALFLIYQQLEAEKERRAHHQLNNGGGNASSSAAAAGGAAQE